MKLDFRVKITLLTFLVAILTSVSLGVVVLEKAKQALVQEEFDGLDNITRLEGTRLRTTIETLRQDVLFLSRIPSVNGIHRAMQASDGSSMKTWRKRMQVIFKEFLNAKPFYLQIRMIGVSDKGREVVRVHWKHLVPHSVEEKFLQSKEDSSYFGETVKLKKGDVYLSEVNLNREYGSVTKPQLPVLRAAVPLKDIKGEVFGIMVINMDFRLPLKDRSMDDRLQYITNAEGDFLGHPELGKTFGFEKGERFQIQQRYPKLAQLFESGNLREELGILDGSKKEKQVVQFIKVPFDPLNPKRFLGFARTLPHAMVLKKLDKYIMNFIVLAFAISFIAMIIVYFLAKFLFASHSEPAASRINLPTPPMKNKDLSSSVPKNFPPSSGEF